MQLTFDNHIHFAAKILQQIQWYEEPVCAVDGRNEIIKEIQTKDQNGLSSNDKQRLFQCLQDAGFFIKTENDTFSLTWKGLQFVSYYRYVGSPL